jgi:hypothetical protein
MEQWRCIVLWKLPLEPWRFTLEPWRLILETWSLTLVTGRLSLEPVGNLQPLIASEATFYM